MRRAITIVTLLALMAGFGFGVNRLIASRKTKIPSETSSYIPTSTRPAIVLPGTLYLAQGGQLYSLSDGFFTSLHSSTSAGTWMQPAYVPGTQNIVAVLRVRRILEPVPAQQSGDGDSPAQQQRGGALQGEPRCGSTTGCSGRVSVPTGTPVLRVRPAEELDHVRRRFLDMVGFATGTLANQRLTTANPFTGGDVDPTPMANGDVIFSRYAISNGARSHSSLSRRNRWCSRRSSPPPLRTADNLRRHPTARWSRWSASAAPGFRAHDLRWRRSSATKLGTPRILVNNCLCSAPDVGPGWQRPRLLQRDGRRRTLRALVDQRRAHRNAGGAVGGDDQPRLRRHIPALVVAADEHPGDDPLVEDLRELVQLARHAALLRNDVCDACDLDAAAAHDRHLTEPAFDDEVIRLRADARRPDAVVGGGRSTALHVAEHGRARLVSGALLDDARQRFTDAAPAELHMAERIASTVGFVLGLQPAISTPSATTMMLKSLPACLRTSRCATTSSTVTSNSGMMIMSAPPARPPITATHPVSRPMTSQTMTRWCDVAVVCRRSSASVTTLTALSKPMQ